MKYYSDYTYSTAPPLYGRYTMTNILVAVDGTESNAHLMEAAIERAETQGGTLVVLYAMTPRLFEARQWSLAGQADLRHDGLTYSTAQARTDARAVAERTAKEAIGDRDVPYTAVGAIGKLVPTVLAVAAENGCETVMLAEEGSWWRRRLGLADRRIARRFDGTVVRVPRPYPSNLETERALPETSS